MYLTRFAVGEVIPEGSERQRIVRDTERSTTDDVMCGYVVLLNLLEEFPSI